MYSALVARFVLGPFIVVASLLLLLYSAKLLFGSSSFPIVVVVVVVVAVVIIVVVAQGAHSIQTEEKRKRRNKHTPAVHNNHVRRFALVVFTALVQSCRGSNRSITRIPSSTFLYPFRVVHFRVI